MHKLRVCSSGNTGEEEHELVIAKKQLAASAEEIELLKEEHRKALKQNSDLICSLNEMIEQQKKQIVRLKD